MCRMSSGRTSIFTSCMRFMTRRRQKGAPAPAASPGLTRRPAGAVRVLTSIEFLSGGVKVYETPLVEAECGQCSGAGGGGVSVRCAADAL